MSDTPDFSPRATTSKPTVSANSTNGLLERIVGIDARTLAVFRIGLALVLLSDLWTRASSLTAFYSDQGVLPRSAQIEIYSNLPWLFSLHLMSGLVAVQVALFVLAFIAGIALLVGYRTKWAAFISWLLLISLHNRNPMTLQGGDVMLRLLLFWSLFLPLQARLSVDRLLSHDSKNSYVSSLPFAAPIFLSIGTMAALLQVCFVYWFSYAIKSDISWRAEGSALYYALNIDQLTRPLGRTLLQYPALTSSFTALTMLIERFGPVIALLPFWRARVAAVLLFFGFHFGLGVCMTLGIFPWVACAGWLLFLPGEFWGKLEKFAVLARLRASINRGLQIIARLVTKVGLARYVSQEVVVDRASQDSRWQNILRQGILGQGIAAIFLVYIFCWNLTTVDVARYGKLIPPHWDALGLVTRTDQSWNMFAPVPMREDGWCLMPARLVNGKEVDLMRDGAAVSWNKPSNVAALFPDAVWQKYLMNLVEVSNSAHRAYFVGYMVRQWNESHGPNERVRSMSFVYMLENTPAYNPSAPIKTNFPTKKLVLWNMNG